MCLFYFSPFFFSYLDSYLPRVVELALNSSNRQTKVVACELLHALVLYMLGTSVQKAAEKNNQVVLELVYIFLSKRQRKFSNILWQKDFNTKEQVLTLHIILFTLEFNICAVWNTLLFIIILFLRCRKNKLFRFYLFGEELWQVWNKVNISF